MTLRSNHLYFMLTWLPLLVATAAVFLGRLPFRGQGPTHSIGRYSEEQISERAAPLCHELEPDVRELRIQCTALSSQDSHNPLSDGTWEVSWSASAAQPGGRLLFDADSGQVEQVSRFDLNSDLSGRGTSSEKDRSRGDRPDSREGRGGFGPLQAEAEARRWLATLRGPVTGVWRLESHLQTASGEWRYRFLNAKIRANLDLSADGKLLSARFR
jgi:hypothetical protein